MQTNDETVNKINNAMMVLEYQMSQHQIKGFDTGISNEDLTRLAHALLQYGPTKLNKQQEDQLAHLHGVALVH